MGTKVEDNLLKSRRMKNQSGGCLLDKMAEIQQGERDLQFICSALLL